jgi:chromate transporter
MDTADSGARYAPVFSTFLRLGLTSFGGPTAHLGYFRREFVERRAWIDEATFAALVAFCSVLPGPTSSQVGMLVGLIRGGAAGAVLAWIGFTAPSAIVLVAFALGLHALEGSGTITESGWFTGLLAGLTAAAAAVVAQAVLGLARTLCTDRETKTIALGAAILAIGLGGVAGLQWLPIALGALVGALFLHAGTIEVPALPLAVPRPVAIGAGLLFAAVVVVLLVPQQTIGLAFLLIETCLRAGSLVFGGGHVVLPLLQGLVDAGLVSSRDFFAGYGLTQAMPGPLFTFAAFLGAVNASPLNGISGAFVATLAIFLPSFALIFALAPVWNRVRTAPRAAATLRGVNASVVGLLAAVLYHPILTSLQASATGIGITLAAFALIDVWKFPPWTVVLASAALGAIAGLLH